VSKYEVCVHAARTSFSTQYGARENVAVLWVFVVLVPSPELALIRSTLTSCFCCLPIGKHGAGRGVGIPSVSTTIPQSTSITDGGLPRPFPALVIQMLALTAHIRVRELPDGAEFLRITLVKVCTPLLKQNGAAHLLQVQASQSEPYWQSCRFWEPDKMGHFGRPGVAHTLGHRGRGMAR
jgi:hypothetical protein